MSHNFKSKHIFDLKPKCNKNRAGAVFSRAAMCVYGNGCSVQFGFGAERYVQEQRLQVPFSFVFIFSFCRTSYTPEISPEHENEKFSPTFE